MQIDLAAYASQLGRDCTLSFHLLTCSSKARISTPTKSLLIRLPLRV
ncbi:MAG: hypothetical protein ACR2PM_03010 [Hyphomicrobiales bacterium]